MMKRIYMIIALLAIVAGSQIQAMSSGLPAARVAGEMAATEYGPMLRQRANAAGKRIQEGAQKLYYGETGYAERQAEEAARLSRQRMNAVGKRIQEGAQKLYYGETGYAARQAEEAARQAPVRSIGGLPGASSAAEAASISAKTEQELQKGLRSMRSMVQEAQGNARQGLKDISTTMQQIKEGKPLAEEPVQEFRWYINQNYRQNPYNAEFIKLKGKMLKTEEAYEQLKQLEAQMNMLKIKIPETKKTYDNALRDLKEALREHQINDKMEREAKLRESLGRSSY